jgi:cobalt-zinc-cadmium efflux system membrane fusion protein
MFQPNATAIDPCTKTGMRFRDPLVLCLLSGVFFTGAVGLAGCSAPATATQAERDLTAAPPDGVVRIAEPSRQFLTVEAAGGATGGATLRAPAHVEFRDGAVSQLGAPFDGRVVKVHVHTGETVRVGDPLVTLDCPDAASVRAAVDTAAASLREARVALDRERRMLEQGIGIEREKLAAETRVAGLEAELHRAEAGAVFIGPGSGTTIIIRAPMAGIVITRKATEGMAVQRSADPLVEIGNPTALWVVADVFERDLAVVRQGAVARVELPSIEGTLDGRVASIGTVVSTGLRTAPVRIAVPSEVGHLRPGMYGRAEVSLAASGGLTLPIEAVLVKGKDTVVYIERNPTTFERRPIVVGQPVNGRVPVISGVSPGDRIVVRGALLLDGSADQLL